MAVSIPDPTPRELGSRFNAVSFLPTAFLVLFVLALVGLGPPFRNPSPRHLAQTLHDLSLAQLAAGSVLVIAVGLIVQPFQAALARLLEGYPWHTTLLGYTLHAMGTEFQWRRWDQLTLLANNLVPLPAYGPWQTPHQRRRVARQRRRRVHAVPAAAAALAAYPDEAGLLQPTRLGNALRAAELRAVQRYGLDTIEFWPRLLPYLSPRLGEVITDLRNQLDTSLRFCPVLALATVISVGLLAVHGVWLLIPAITALSSWVAYRAAVRAAIAYGRQLEIAFDLHRFDMLRALNLPLPDEPVEERRRNKELSDFIKDYWSRDPGLLLRVERYDRPPDKPAS